MIGLQNTIRCKSHRLLGWPKLPFLVNRNDPALHDCIAKILTDYYRNKLREYPLLIKKEFDLVIQGNPRYIDWTASRRIVHDEDFRILGAFKEKDSLILDVGANWGFSVLSMRSSGAACKIVSFEPVHYYEPCLQQVFDRNLGFHDYTMVGLGDQNATLKLVVPVVNRIPVFGLATGVEQPEIDTFAKNILDHIRLYLPQFKNIYVQLLELNVEVDTLDRRMEHGICRFKWNDIAAIKLDIEGMEYTALKGGTLTLKQYKPLVMLEGGNRWNGVSEHMRRLGYRYAERADDKLAFTDQQGTAINGFFVHDEKIDTYREMNILA